MCKTRQSNWLTVVFTVMLQVVGRGWGQETTVETPPEPTAPEPAALRSGERAYSFPMGAGGINLSVGVQGQYIDNVFLTDTQKRDDYLLIPELDLAYLHPFGVSNTLALDIGVAYYNYFKNTSLNTGTPLINPNSEFALNLHSGDFRFRFSEAFYYQEDPVYEYGDTFYNVFNTGRFARYYNRVGALGTWDLNRLQVNAGYFHENLWANGSTFNYIDHASDLFNADALYAISPAFRAGWEALGSDNRFDNRELLDSWRVRTGPALRWELSRFVRARLGGGYERIQYDSSAASEQGLDGQNTFYAYAGLEQEVSRFFSHMLEVVHDNQLGYNAGNLAGTRINYSFAWRPNRRLTLTPRVSVNFFNESFDSQPNLYHERFTYVAAGVGALYQFNRHWQGGLNYEYRLKDSEFDTASYAQNRVGLDLTYLF